MRVHDLSIIGSTFALRFIIMSIFLLKIFTCSNERSCSN